MLIAGGGRRWAEVVGGSLWPSLAGKVALSPSMHEQSMADLGLCGGSYGVLATTHGMGGVGGAPGGSGWPTIGWGSNQKNHIVGPPQCMT